MTPAQRVVGLQSWEMQPAVHDCLQSGALKVEALSVTDESPAAQVAAAMEPGGSRTGHPQTPAQGVAGFQSWGAQAAVHDRQWGVEPCFGRRAGAAR